MKEPTETEIWDTLDPRERMVIPEHLRLPFWVRMVYIFSIYGMILYYRDYKRYKTKIRQLKKELRE